MQNNIASLSKAELLQLGEAASSGALALGTNAGLTLNKADRVSADFTAADAAVRAYQTEVANRVAKAAALEQALSDARTWCFRAKDTLKPFCGDAHNSLWGPTGFVTSLRVAEDYGGLLALVSALSQYLAEHPEQRNDSLKVNVTATRAEELHGALKAAKAELGAQEALIDAKHLQQEQALEKLRDRLRGLIGELKQLIGTSDGRWRRFGFNIPDEPEIPTQPEGVQVNNSTPGQLLVSCAPVPFAERYRWFVQKTGTTGEPTPAGSSNEPLFVLENLEAEARFNVVVSAVNLAGKEGPRSEPAVAEVVAKAA
jgi:hypothetical protein